MGYETVEISRSVEDTRQVPARSGLSAVGPRKSILTKIVKKAPGKPRLPPAACASAGLLMVSGAVLLDAAEIDEARWGNRLPDGFLRVDYLRLLTDIRSTGGNLVPILVRPVVDHDGARKGYQLVYGHRRLQACRDLGVPVTAFVQALTDGGAAARIAAENRVRKNLAPIEEGLFFRRLLDAKVYPSLRRLAHELRIDAGDASRKLFLASLPKSILCAVTDPLRLSCAHARHLSALLEHDLESNARRAKALVTEHGTMTPRELIEALLAAKSGDVGNSNGSVDRDRQVLVADGQRVGSWSRDSNGGLTIRLAVSLPEPQQEALLRSVEAALSRHLH